MDKLMRQNINNTNPQFRSAAYSWFRRMGLDLKKKGDRNILAILSQRRDPKFESDIIAIKAARAAYREITRRNAVSLKK